MWSTFHKSVCFKLIFSFSQQERSERLWQKQDKEQNKHHSVCFSLFLSGKTQDPVDDFSQSTIGEAFTTDATRPAFTTDAAHPNESVSGGV